MSKPNDSLKHVKLPGENTQREIIPSRLTDDTHVAELPSMSKDGIISLTEREYKDTTNNFSGYQSDMALRKVYTGFCGVANGSAPNNNSRANRSCYFATIKPLSWSTAWCVKYHLNIHLDNENQLYKSSSTASVINEGQLMKGVYQCMISGAKGYMRAYANFNTINDTSYRPAYYIILHETTETGFNNGCGHKLGVDITDATLPTPVTDYSSGSAVANTPYPRTIEVIIDEAVNCEVTLNNTLEVEADAYEYISNEITEITERVIIVDDI